MVKGKAYLVTGRERYEIDVGWRKRVISEGALDGTEIVGSYGGQRSAPADVLMKLVLLSVKIYGGSDGSSHRMTLRTRNRLPVSTVPYNTTAC